MSFTDDKIVVYLGYPAESSDVPHWMSSLLQKEMTEKESHPYRFFISGGSVTPELLSVLKGRGEQVAQAHEMSIRLSRGFPSRLIDALVSPDIEKISNLALSNPGSSEFRVLLDLYVLSRSDIYFVDCNLMGGGRCGMELVYSHDMIPTIGVSDSLSIDPWYHYHTDLLVKSQMAALYLDKSREHILYSRSNLPKSQE